MPEAIGSNPGNQMNSLWISANAGAGKTTALVGRVIKLLLLGVTPERICCITYTKAAAGEMRQRITEKLRHLLVMEHAACVAELNKILGFPAQPEHIARARSLFASVLDSAYGGIGLMTIHGFCQQLLAQFPLEAGVSPHFTVLEDAEAETLQRAARMQLLGELEDGPLADALALVADRMGETRFDQLMKAILGKRHVLAPALAHHSAVALAANIREYHGVEEGWSVANQQAHALAHLVTGNEATVIRAEIPFLLRHKNKTEQALGSLFQRWLEIPDAQATLRAPLLTEMLRAFLTVEGRAKKTAFSKALEDTLLGQCLGRIRARAESFAQRCAAIACAEESAAVALLAKAYLSLYAQRKFERQALDYDDLIVNTRALLAVQTGWVMSKLDQRIDHLLIDEAQDTSPDQWVIARALVEELIATTDGIGSGEVPRSLLVVGDEKQSIFSFQGAAPEYFAAEYGWFVGALSGSASPLNRMALATSYRSSQPILQLVDAVAAIPSVGAALTADGVAPTHQLYRVGAAGKVVLHAPLATPEKTPHQPFVIPRDYSIASSAAETLAQQVAGEIAAWLRDGRSLENEGRPLRAGDILILVRNRNPMIPALIRALEAQDVPLAAIDRLKLAEHLAVRDLLALMAWCVQPTDDLALAQVLRSPIVGISDAALLALAHGRTGTLWAQLRGEESYADTVLLLERCRARRTATPYEFLTALLDVWGAAQRFAQRFGDEVLEVLDELKSQAVTMPAAVQPTVMNFYAQMTRSSREVKREQETSRADALRIMTVHGAKGLEAPVVLMVDTTSVPNLRHEIIYQATCDDGRILPLIALSDEARRAPHFEAVQAQRKAAILAEYQRLLYVALTRPRDELHLYATVDARGNIPLESWYANVRTALQSLPCESAEDGTLTLECARTAPHAAADATTHTTSLQPVPTWARTPLAALRPMQKMVAPSRLVQGATTIAANSPTVDANLRGTRIHRVLQFLTARSDQAHIQQLVTHFAPDWDTATCQKVIAEIATLQAQERWLWEHPSHAEVNIGGQVQMGDAWVSVTGQIDRLVQTPEALVVVDYKTGKHVPPTEMDTPLSYLIQLKTYRDLLRPLYPTLPVRVALLWTAVPKLMWLDAGVEQAAWPALNDQDLMHNTAASA